MDDDINAKITKLQEYTASLQRKENNDYQGKDSKSIHRKTKIVLGEESKSDKNKLKSYTCSVSNRNKSRTNKSNLSGSRTGGNRSTSRTGSKKRLTQSRTNMDSISHRSKNSKRSTSRDLSKQKTDLKRQTIQHNISQGLSSTQIRFKNVNYGKYWKRE